MLVEAILVYGVIGYKFCRLLLSEDQNQGTLASHESVYPLIFGIDMIYQSLVIITST